MPSTRTSGASARSETLSIALLGTRGVPARYGGFETCVEEVGRRLAERGHRVVVYCRDLDGSERADSYLGMELVHHGALKKRTLETLSHSSLAAWHLARHRTDAAVVFNAANAPVLPLLRAARIPVATHVDGLEWKRDKWGPMGQRYYKTAERLSVWWSDALIADAAGIADYYREKFRKETDLIAYGAPRIDDGGGSRLGELGLTARGYHLVVARFEPENHVDMIVDGYVRSRATRPLVVVGSAPYADEYTARVHGLGDRRVQFLGGVWDQELLDQLYANSLNYLHGHSVGGTNPSLLRAIGAGAPTTAFDVVFNREVLADAGLYFSDPSSVARAIERVESDLDATAQRGHLSRERAASYDWDDVADRYEALCRRLAGRPRLGALSTANVGVELADRRRGDLEDVTDLQVGPAKRPTGSGPVEKVG